MILSESFDECFFFVIVKKGFLSGKLFVSLNYFVVFVKEWFFGELRKINVFYFYWNKFCEDIVEYWMCYKELGLG